MNKPIQPDIYGNTIMTSLYEIITTSLKGKNASSRKDDMGVLSIAGSDNQKFLQGQVTCDMAKLSDKEGLYGAICSNKGRIITNFYLIKKDDAVLMVMSKDLVETTLLYLKKYAVFFKVELTNDNTTFAIHSQIALTSNVAPSQLEETLPVEYENDLIQITISDYPTNVKLIVSDVNNNDIQDDNPELTQLAILAARPLINEAQTESILPQWINMQRTGGISFTKGCYTGQEIIARMQYRGKSKKQLALFQWEGVLDTSKEMTDDENNNLGTIFRTIDIQGTQLAQVILNNEPNDTDNFHLDGSKVSLLPLPYALESEK